MVDVVGWGCGGCCMMGVVDVVGWGSGCCRMGLSNW